MLCHTTSFEFLGRSEIQ